MKIQVDIDVPVPRWARTAAFVLVPLGVVLATTTIVRANVPNTFQNGDTLSAQKVNDDFSSLDGRVTTLEMGAGVPSGTIVSFGGEIAPAGWLPCDGTELDGTNAKFAALYAAIGTAYGGNTTSMQFNLPDLRGRFLRGWDHGAGHDPEASARAATASGGNAGDAVGSQQSDQIHTHNHPLSDPGHTHQSVAALSGGEYLMWGGGAGMCVQAAMLNGGNCTAGGMVNPATGAAGTGVSLQPAGGAETRPLNITVNYIIKL
jgi:microcystin-dependent protein